MNTWLVSRNVPAPADPGAFPPELVVAVNAIACELPTTLGVPLSRLHVPDIRQEVLSRSLVADISGTTIWRWLTEDAIKPWTHRSWIFPRDPDFEAKAARVLAGFVFEVDTFDNGGRQPTPTFQHSAVIHPVLLLVVSSHYTARKPRS